MELCPSCGMEKAPMDYVFPLSSREKVPYCRCIKWGSLYTCLRLSISNSKRLLSDGDFLLSTASPDLYAWWKRGEKAPQNIKNPTDEEARDLASTIDYPRLITSLSLLLLSLQELGKSFLAIDYIRAKRDLNYQKDYRTNFSSHGPRIEAAKTLMTRLNRWPPALEKRSKDLEALRQASLYVDYDFTLGLWLDPSALGSPEESGSLYSGAIFSGLVEILGGSNPDAQSQYLTNLHIGTERFNTFAYCFLLKSVMEGALKDVEAAATELTSAEARKEEFESLRLREYLDVAYLPENDRGREMMKRLDSLTRIYSPGIAEGVDKAMREHFKVSEN